MSHTFFLFLLTAEQGCYSAVPNWFLRLSGGGLGGRLHRWNLNPVEGTTNPNT